MAAKFLTPLMPRLETEVEPPVYSDGCNFRALALAASGLQTGHRPTPVLGLAR